MARAMPKSATFTWPVGVMMTLPGLMSRCTTPLRWAKPSAPATSAGDLGGALRVQRALAADDLREAAPVDVLHDDEVGARLLAPVVDADDVGVVEVGRRLGLAAEPLDEGAGPWRTRGTGP